MVIILKQCEKETNVKSSKFVLYKLAKHYPTIFVYVRYHDPIFRFKALCLFDDYLAVLCVNIFLYGFV